MHSLRHLVGYVQQHGFGNKLLFTVCGIGFFFSFADGLLAFLMPLIIVEHGFSKTEMGLIIGTSSVAGAVFDILLSKYLTRPDYRRLYLAVLLMVGVFAWLLYSATSAGLFILAMAVWGLYWDLFHFADYDFVSHTTAESEHAATFGVLRVFEALGWLIAPLVAGLAITGTVIGGTPFMVAGILVGLGLILWLLLGQQTRWQGTEASVHRRVRPVNWWREIQIWEIVGHQLFPLLCLMFLIFTTDAFVWTIGPLIAESGAFGALGGLVVTAYVVPILFTGWFVGSVTHRFGKKRTALVAFLIGSAILSLLPLAVSPVLTVITMVCASTFLAVVIPTLNGAFADYISESKTYEKEIQGLSDFFYNLGWAIGPAAAGFLADTVGNVFSFTILGVVGVIAATILLKVTPKSIRVKVNPSLSGRKRTLE